MIVQCSWCRRIITAGDPALPTSHGICRACSDRLHADMDAAAISPVEQAVEEAARLRRVA